MEQRFVLDLDGKLAGRMFSVQGGLLESSLTDDSIGTASYRVKHISTLEIEPLVLVFGTGMSQSFYDWIGKAVFARSHQRRSGSVIQLDDHSKVLYQRDFYDALVTKVVFPDLDASSKSEATLKIVLQPERARSVAGESKKLGVYASSLPKAWSVNHFKMSIDGLHTDPSHITKITGLSAKQGIKKLFTGTDRFPAIEPTKLEFPNFTVELPTAYGKEFIKWHEESIGPRKSHAAEKGGSVAFLAPGSSSAYFELKLEDLGIVSMAKSGATYQIQLMYRTLSMTAGSSAVK